MPPSHGCQAPGLQVVNLGEDVTEKLLADEITSIEADEDAVGTSRGSAKVGAILALRGVPVVESVGRGSVPVEDLQEVGTRRDCAHVHQGHHLLVFLGVQICQDRSC